VSTGMTPVKATFRISMIAGACVVMLAHAELWAPDAPGPTNKSIG